MRWMGWARPSPRASRVFGAVVLGFEQLVFHFAQMSYLTRVQLLVERSWDPRCSK